MREKYRKKGSNNISINELQYIFNDWKIYSKEDRLNKET